MLGLLRKGTTIAREEGLSSLYRSARWYFIARNILPPFKTRPALMRRYIAARRRLQPGRYTDADPFKIIWIDPQRIETMVRGRTVPLSFGRVVGGDWDCNATPLTNDIVIQSIERRFRDGCSWTDTELSERLEASADTDVGLDVSNPEIYFEQLETLAERIRTDGYTTQAELYRNSPTAAWRRTERDLRPIHPLFNEIGVNLGRDGTVHWRHRGRHRLALGRALDVDRVAVQILTRHAEWQKRRDNFSPEQEENAEHPDLRDLRQAVMIG